MLYSMTGFGNSNGHFQNKKISVEMRCLNSKINDFRLKTPASYRQRELEVRKLLNDLVVRGKLDVTINIESSDDDDEFKLNTKLFKSFYNQIKTLGTEIDFSKVDMLNAILKFPNVIESHETLISEEEFAMTMSLLEEAVEKLNDFRSLEGTIITNDMVLRLKLILDALSKVEEHDIDRKKLLNDRLMNSLLANVSKEHIDKNRFEQEIILYLERLDITEEKIRLKQHCDYFLQELKSKEKSKSKKLNFISQEIGREINTLGAKAQNSSIQKLVVEMKDELEKIKEQLNNVL
ncbi:MAG: YicC/YloC family endoribonuclease [Saprospiraceae bacterium]|nr:YicC family protein [Saprospiraceae bacterium]MBK7465532.1 YicC family protein [Saprospiraceae bacterium]MBK9992455.1 YicC family protein [Saprospiraceae bacterium]